MALPIMPSRRHLLPTGQRWGFAARSSAFADQQGGRLMIRDMQPDRSMLDFDALLLKVAQNRDKAAFKVLFDHFAPRLKGFVMRQGCEDHLADEVVQEAMINVWRKAGQFDPVRASASTWMYTIARNMRIDLLRKVNRPEPDMNDPALVPDPEPSAHQRIAETQEALRLRGLIDDLPTEQQQVLRMAFFEEQAHGEIAAALDIPLGTVKSRIRLALKRLRAEYGEDA